MAAMCLGRGPAIYRNGSSHWPGGLWGGGGAGKTEAGGVGCGLTLQVTRDNPPRNPILSGQLPGRAHPLECLALRVSGASEPRVLWELCGPVTS